MTKKQKETRLIMNTFTSFTSSSVLSAILRDCAHDGAIAAAAEFKKKFCQKSLYFEKKFVFRKNVCVSKKVCATKKSLCNKENVCFNKKRVCSISGTSRAP